MNNSALEILENTISEYNKNTSDLNKFAFSAREKEIFVSMMKRYAFECSKASLEKASEGPSFYKVNSKCERIYGVNKDTITDQRNIVLL